MNSPSFYLFVQVHRRAVHLLPFAMLYTFFCLPAFCLHALPLPFMLLLLYMPFLLPFALLYLLHSFGTFLYSAFEANLQVHGLNEIFSFFFLLFNGIFSIYLFYLMTFSSSDLFLS